MRFSKRLRSLLLLTSVWACGGTETTVNLNATGVDLTIRHTESAIMDQVRISVDFEGVRIYGPTFVPETPRLLGTVETLVVLLDEDRSGQTVRLDVAGYNNGLGLAEGATDVALLAQSLTPALIDLVVAAPASCGDGICAINESNCTCAADCPPTCGDACCSAGESFCDCESDCPQVCGDGCCSAPQERKQNCAADCQ
jgi:hypothetical protein